MPKSATKNSAHKSEYSFYKHQTFHIRDVWLHKGIKILNRDPRSLSPSSNSHHELGIVKNMLDALRYWMQATGLAEPDKEIKTSPTPLITTRLANLILDNDPYFEDSVSLWLVHIELASNRKLATMWYWLFNEYGIRDFNNERVANSLEEGNQGGVPLRVDYMSHDFSCFIRTYLPSSDRNGISSNEMECPLASLGLVRPSGTPGMFRFSVGNKKDMDNVVFAYTLYKFHETQKLKSQTLSLEDIRYSPFSPGRLLCLDNRSISERLEELQSSSDNLAEVNRTAGVNSVFLNEKINALDIVGKYYKSYEVPTNG